MITTWLCALGAGSYSAASGDITISRVATAAYTLNCKNREVHKIMKDKIIGETSMILSHMILFSPRV